MTKIKLGFYEHYKGRLYEVIGTVRNDKTCEEQVLYRACYEDPIYGKNCLWHRSFQEFKENIGKDDEDKPRFKFIGETLEDILD